jgi:hypothetical protein
MEGGGMSETPETDAVQRWFPMAANVGGHVVDADFSKKLERERDEALAMVKRLLYVAYLGPESQEKYNVLDDAQQFIKDK